MNAVVTKVTIDESAMDPQYTTLREQIIPRVREAPGFVGGYWLAPVDGKALSVVVFETEEVARQAANSMGVKPGGSITPGVVFDSVDFIEVAGGA